MLCCPQHQRMKHALLLPVPAITAVNDRLSYSSEDVCGAGVAMHASPISCEVSHVATSFGTTLHVECVGTTVVLHKWQNLIRAC